MLHIERISKLNSKKVKLNRKKVDFKVLCQREQLWDKDWAC